MKTQTVPLRNIKHLLPQTTPTKQRFWSAERRRFVRFPGGWTIRFAELGEKSSSGRLHAGKCKNLSQGGMKIASLEPVSRKAIVLIEIDPHLFSKHVKLEHILCTKKNRILTEVTWRHLNLDTGVFEAGLFFLKERDRRQYELLIAQANAI